MKVTVYDRCLSRRELAEVALRVGPSTFSDGERSVECYLIPIPGGGNYLIDAELVNACAADEDRVEFIAWEIKAFFEGQRR